MRPEGGTERVRRSQRLMWGIFKRPADPLKARERELEAELARLRSEVARLASEDPTPVMAEPKEADRAVTGGRPAVRPGPAAVSARAAAAQSPPPPLPEDVVRKYDLAAAWRRWLGHFRGPTANNPRMARMLAAGSIHGLRPLRYERRVARNRFIALFVILLLILWGLGYTYLRNR